MNAIQIGQVTNSTNIPDAIIYTYTLPFDAKNFTFTTPQSFTNVASVGVFITDPDHNSGIPATALGFTLNTNVCPDIFNCNVSGFARARNDDALGNGAAWLVWGRPSKARAVEGGLANGGASVP